MSQWLADLRSRYDFGLIEVHCSAAPELMSRRFRERWEAGGRHPGHTGEFTDEAAFIDALESRDYRPVGIGTVIGVDTSDPERVDLGHVVTTIREGMDGPEDR